MPQLGVQVGVNKRPVPTRPFYYCANCPHHRAANATPEPGAIVFITRAQAAHLLRNNSHHRPRKTVPAA